MRAIGVYICLRHIINYKVLKLRFFIIIIIIGLRHIINYKVLKPFSV